MNKIVCMVDSFSTTTPPRRGQRKPTYAEVKAEVLAAGRFSVFEAGERPGIFSQIERDPELVCSRDLGYPWIRVQPRAGEGAGEPEP